MLEETATREDRRVRIDTVDGAIVGSLRISPSLRTLDDLNLVSKRFITLHSPESLTDSWQLGRGPLSINKDSILFVCELSTPPPLSGGRYGEFTRAAVHLRIRQFQVEGFVHLPPGGVPMKRLDQDTHPFVSLTTVLVCGPGEDTTTPFLAVNRSQITAAQVVEPEEATVGFPSPGSESS